jgi:hypothetical protein
MPKSHTAVGFRAFADMAEERVATLRGWREQSRGGSSPLDRTIHIHTEPLRSLGFFVFISPSPVAYEQLARH